MYCTLQPQYGGGAAVYCGGGSPAISGCSFVSNAGAFESRGAIWLTSDGPFTIDDCLFESNTAGSGGGAIALDPLTMEAQLTLSRCTFVGNSARQGGAALLVGVSTVTDCTFYGNWSDMPDRGGALMLGGTAEIRNTIIAYSSGGGAAYCSNGSAVLECCDVYGNGGGDWVGCFEGQDGTNGNISLDPKFCDASGEDFTLEAGSPCQADYNPDCGLIGAWPVACGDPASVREPAEDDPPATATTWGGLKALFRCIRSANPCSVLPS